MACRGSGRVISNLGGSPSTVACPWCGGSGLRSPDIDAQAHWAAQDAGSGAQDAGEARPQNGSAEAPGETERSTAHAAGESEEPAPDI
jgi:hypothetical protein